MQRFWPFSRYDQSVFPSQTETPGNVPNIATKIGKNNVRPPPIVHLFGGFLRTLQRFWPFTCDDQSVFPSQTETPGNVPNIATKIDKNNVRPPPIVHVFGGFLRTLQHFWPFPRYDQSVFPSQTETPVNLPKIATKLAKIRSGRPQLSIFWIFLRNLQHFWPFTRYDQSVFSSETKTPVNLPKIATKFAKITTGRPQLSIFWRFFTQFATPLAIFALRSERIF